MDCTMTVALMLPIEGAIMLINTSWEACSNFAADIFLMGVMKANFHATTAQPQRWS